MRHTAKAVQRRLRPFRLEFLLGLLLFGGLFWSERACCEPTEPNRTTVEKAGRGSHDANDRTHSKTSNPKASAKLHYRQGVALYRLGRFEESLAEFQRAYLVSPHFAVLFNIGNLQSELGRAAEAVEAFERYFQEGAGQIDAFHEREARRVLAQNEKRVGRLKLEVEPAGAGVVVDGSDWPEAAQPRIVTEGSHSIEVTAEGYSSKTRTISVARGETLVVRVALERVAASRVATGWLRVTCPIPSVKLRVDGGSTTVLNGRDELVPLAHGTHQLSFERPGYAARVVGVDVPADGIVERECGLYPLRELPQTHRSSLIVNVSDPAARVTVDGSPFRNGSLPVGLHRVKVIHGDHSTFEESVDLAPGEVRALSVASTRQLLALDQERSVERARSRRRIAYAFGGGGIALASGAIVALAVGSRRYDEWQEKHVRLANGDGETANWTNAADEAVTIQRIEDLGIGLGIASLACLATATYLFLSGDSTNGLRPSVTSATSALWKWNY